MGKKGSCSTEERKLCKKIEITGGGEDGKANARIDYKGEKIGCEERSEGHSKGLL